MTLAWNPFALGGLLAGGLMVTLSAVVYLTRPDRDQNRFLALYFYAGGFFMIVWWGLRHLWTEPGLAIAAGNASMVAFVPWIVSYPLFLSTLDVKIVRPLRRPVVRGVIVAAGALFLLATLAAPELLVRAAHPFRYVGGYDYESGPLRTAILLLLPLWTAFGLVVTIGAWRSAKGPLLRRQARTYALGFLVSDGALFLWLVHRAVGQPWTGDLADELLLVLLPPFAIGWLVLVLAYGILKLQLFDIDLRLKGAVRESLVGGAIGLAFFVAKESAERAFDTGGAVVGLAAALAVSLAFRRLRRIAQHVANALMPSVRENEAYRRARKIDVYRAALEGANADGVRTEKEEAFLRRLREDLGLSREDVLFAERSTPAAKPLAGAGTP